MKLQSVSELKETYKRQVSAGDDKQHLTFANLKMQEGRDHFTIQNYRAASACFYEAVSSSVKNFLIIETFSDSPQKNKYSLKAKEFMLDQLTWAVAAFILNKNLDIKLGKYHLRKTIIKAGYHNFSGYKFGPHDIDYVMDHAIILVLKKQMRSGTTISDLKNYFQLYDLDSTDKQDAKSARIMLLLEYIRFSKLNHRIESDSAEELAKAFVMLAHEYHSNNFTLYLENITESLKFSCLGAISLNDFENRLAKLEAYMQTAPYPLSRSERKRKIALELVFALSRGLELSKEIAEKTSYANRIVGQYKIARHYNLYRFNVYVDWLQSAQAILNISRTDEASLKELRNTIKRKDGLKFQDRDEQWLAENIPQIIYSRANLGTINKYLEGMLNKTELLTGSPELNSSLYLYRAGWLDFQSAFGLLKRYVKDELRILDNPTPLSLVEQHDSQPELPVVNRKHLTTISNGENEVVEFKETWKYDLENKGSSKEIEFACIKTLAAFMNSQGGVLYVGVKDNKEIVGLDNTDFLLTKSLDLGKKIDKLRLIIDNAIQSKLGTSHLISVKITNQVNFERKHYLAIEVEPSITPVYVDGELYIRGSASTIPVRGKELIDYYNSRFK